jgi:outer membrane lipoprotein-sorting protein
MLNKNYIIVGLIVAVALLLVWNASIRRQVEEKQVTITKLERDIEITRQKETEKVKSTVKVTTKPDGTVITETINQENKTKVSDKITDKSKETTEQTTTKVVTNDRTRYSIGIYSTLDRDISASVGANIGDLPVEAVLLGTDNYKTLSLGVVFRW